MGEGEGNYETINSLELLIKTTMKFFPPHPHLTLSDDCLHSLQPGYMHDNCITTVDFQSVKTEWAKHKNAEKFRQLENLEKLGLVYLALFFL